MEKIPFDEVAFRNGGVALYADCMERFCKTIDGELFAVDEEGISQVNFDTEEERIEFMHKHYTMKSKPVDDWISVKGDGTIPAEIAGAKAGEWELKLRSGRLLSADASADEAYLLHFNRASDIVAVRLVEKKEEKPADNPPCKGANCGSIDGRTHSEECYAEHEETTRIKSPVTAPPILPISQNEMLRIAGEAMCDGTKGGGPIVKCDALAALCESMK